MKERYSKERFKRASEDVEESKQGLPDNEQKQANRGKDAKAGSFAGLQVNDRDTLGIRFVSAEGAQYNRDLERKNDLFDAAHNEATEINKKMDELKKQE